MAIPRIDTLSNKSFFPITSPDTPLLYTINTEAVRTFQYVCFGVIVRVIAIFGIGTNIINIICFIKQGFKESINISLLGLAISDLGCLLTVIWVNICMVPAFQEADLPFDPLDTQHLTTGLPHLMFTRVTAVITAFIGLERCLCITMPLKVKNIFTSTRVAIINISIFITLIVCFCPVYSNARLGKKYDEARNRTVLGIVTSEYTIVINQVSFAINSVLIPSSALSIIIVCMVTLVIKLQRQTKWRQSNREIKNVDSSSERDVRLVKMIVMISILFVVCFLPSVIILLFVTMEPEFSVGGKYVQVTIIAYGFVAVAESTNSSMNIFIYYKMSSKYRAYFLQILRSEKAVEWK